MTEIAVERVASPKVEPVGAFAKLRSYTPGRGAFLLESREAGHPAGRYSIVGYRVRGGHSMLPQVDAVEVAATLEGAPRPESFAAALALATVGYFSAAVASSRHRIPPFGDEGSSGMFDEGATVMVFDHQEGSATVAGPAKGNLVPRLLYELEHGPEIPDAPVRAGEPRRLSADLDDDRLALRARRAQGFLDEDDLPEVVLAQRYRAPLGGGNPFDAYRALRELAPAPFGYFVSFGATPMAPSSHVLGVADTLLYLQRRDDESPSVHATLGAALARAQGDPSALRLIRRLEETSRQIYGGAVGYLCPGGEAAFFLADRVISVVGDEATVTVGAPLRFDDAPDRLSEQLRERAAPLLSAVHSAQTSEKSDEPPAPR